MFIELPDFLKPDLLVDMTGFQQNLRGMQHDRFFMDGFCFFNTKICQLFPDTLTLSSRIHANHADITCGWRKYLSRISAWNQEGHTQYAGSFFANKRM